MGAGYSMDPPLRQLAAAASSDPDSLRTVADFTLTRRGVGSLRWLVPVDVVGLELEAIARIDPGEVAVYTEVPKPPVGTGLNTACEVTLLGVHKKKGGQVRAARVGAARRHHASCCAPAGPHTAACCAVTQPLGLLPAARCRRCRL